MNVQCSEKLGLPRLKMINCHKVICGCKNCLSESIMQSEISSCRSRHIEKFISVTEISHSRRLGQEKD